MHVWAHFLYLYQNKDKSISPQSPRSCTISLEGLFSFLLLLPMLFPLTDFPPQIHFQWPRQSLEIPRQYLAVEVSSFSSSMKCLWNPGVCLSAVCSEQSCTRLGWRGWWYACRITIVTPVTWSEADLSSGSFLWVRLDETSEGQVRFVLARCSWKSVENMRSMPAHVVHQSEKKYSTTFNFKDPSFF